MKNKSNAPLPTLPYDIQQLWDRKVSDDVQKRLDDLDSRTFIASSGQGSKLDREHLMSVPAVEDDQ